MSFVAGTVERWGINWAGLLEVSHPGDNELWAQKRCVYVPGERTYDPSGMTGDPHASERVGPSCALTQNAVTALMLVGLMRGGGKAELDKVQSMFTSVIACYHGRKALSAFMALQMTEAFLELPDAPTPFPTFMRALADTDTAGFDLGVASREHSRKYLASWEGGDPCPPAEYFRKVLQKDKEADLGLSAADYATLKAKAE